MNRPTDSTITRRNMIRAAGFSAAAAALLPAAALRADSLAEAATPTPIPGAPPIKLGLASYTFRNFDRAQLIGFMKTLRVDALNAKDVKDHLPMDQQEESKALADYAAAGITLHAAGAIYFTKNDEADIRSKFDYCKRAGISVIVAGDPDPAALPLIEKAVREYDMRFAIHNHGPEDKIFHSPLDVLSAVKSMDPRMGCCIDVGHTVRAGVDVIDAIHAAGPRLFNMHMKDLTNFNEKESQVAVGEGKMPVPAIFEALGAINYPGFVDLEYEVHADDPMPGVTSSFAYMRGVLAGMASANAARK
jgi:sugar phosphate isomerase/epimerase